VSEVKDSYRRRQRRHKEELLKISDLGSESQTAAPLSISLAEVIKVHSFA
jgi:hypothetical protein